MPGGAGGVMAQFSLLPTQPTNERSSSFRTRHHTPRERGKVAGVKSAASNFPDKNAWDSKKKNVGATAAHFEQFDTFMAL